MAHSSNNIEEKTKSSTVSSNSDTNVHKVDSNWWLKHLQDESKNNNYIITNLVAELAILLNDKIRLEGENAVLQIENEDFSKKQKEMKINYENESINMTNKIKNLEICVKQLENNIKQSNGNHLEETKSYLLDIKTLKEQYESLKESSDTNMYDFKILINNLERELEIINGDNAELVEEIKNCRMKMQKYKEKLKMSTNMICKLNNIITTFASKSLYNKKTQTDDTTNMCMEPVQVQFQHEKIISQLFFKQNPADIIDPLLKTFENSNVRF